MTTRRKFIQHTATTFGGISLLRATPFQSLLGSDFISNEKIAYVKRFKNENHPEIGYWFISPDLLPGEKYLQYLNDVVAKSPFTLVFLTARDGADFYDYATWHPVLKKLVTESHKRNIKIGLQLWQNEKNVKLDNGVRMLVDHEVMLDDAGHASLTSSSEFIRFPDRLLKTDLFKVYAFRKTREGFYDPATLKEITHRCQVNLPDKETVAITIRGGSEVRNLTAYVITQEYCSQNNFYCHEEFENYASAIDQYADIPFDGFALDEYGYKFVSRAGHDLPAGEPFRGRWYADSMAKKFEETNGSSLIQTLYNARYAPEGRAEVRMKAINTYMDFMRGGALIVQTKVYNYSRKVFGDHIFNGIHDTYHNSLINDEIWANGICWWKLPWKYGQTDELTPLPVQMGIAMVHPENVVYNQFYGHTDSPVPVLKKALSDLTFGVRTHYHAMNDKRPNRYDLGRPEGIAGVNKVEHCARLLNKFNPLLPSINLLVIFGMEGLCNWYPDKKERGTYDINDKMDVVEKGVDMWNAGYLNAIIPSDFIAEKKLTLDKNGKPTINGHTFQAMVYINPQYAKDAELDFLEAYVERGGKLMLEGKATHNFEARDITGRFESLYAKATVQSYAVADLPKLGIEKNFIPGGCKTEDNAYVFTDYDSLFNNSAATFSVIIEGDKYEGNFEGLAVIRAGKKAGVAKFAANGFTSLKRNGKVILSFSKPVSVFIDNTNGKASITIEDSTQMITPAINKI